MVYLLFKTYDKDIIKKISSRGMTVWVDGDGGRSKELGFVYHAPPRFGRRAKQGNSKKHRTRPGIIRGIQKSGNSYEPIDMFARDMNATLLRGEDDEYIIYEAQFSLYEMRQLAKQKNVDKGKVAFLMELGVMGDSQMLHSRSGGRSRVGFSGGVGYGGGGIGMGAGRQGMGGMNNLPSQPQSDQIFINSVLARG